MEKSVLYKDVSSFANYSNKEPVTLKLLHFLQSEDYKDKVGLIRSIDDKTRRDKLKAGLPCITPSGVFSPTRAAENLKKHSGLLQFDLDCKGNENITDWSGVRDELKKIPEIAYCGLSVSGRGIWGLVPIAYSNKHKEHFQALKYEFHKIGLTLDGAPQNVASLRGYSFDEHAVFNHNARTFFKTNVASVVNAPSKKLSYTHTSTHKEIEKTEYLIKQLIDNEIDITGTYTDWLAIASCFACEFREAGRSYFHEVSQFYPGYKATEADRQYNACLRSSKGFDIGIFYRACLDHGIMFKTFL